MRAAVLTRRRAAVLLAGPTVLAFFSGGYFDEAQAWAGLVVWVLVAVGDRRGRPSRCRSKRGDAARDRSASACSPRWTLLSITWAPIAGSAYHAGQLVILYAGGAARGRRAAA